MTPGYLRSMVATDEYRALARRAARRLRVAFAARVFAGIALAVVAFASLLVASAADAKRIVYCTRHHHPRGCVAIPRVARQPARRSQQGPDSLTPSNVVNGGGLGGGPGDHRSAAVSWARSQQRLTRWAWRCERFVEEAYGTRGKFDTAGQAVAKLALHRGPVTEAPPGSLVYFGANQANRGFGHVGLSLGQGRIISALARVTVTDVAHSRYWSTLYRGWADAPASWPGRIPPPPGPTLEDPGLNVRVTAPAFGSMVSGSVPIAATATDASGVRFFAYYAARQVDPATRAWHLIGDGRAADGGWITDSDTTAIPDQGNPLWGTVNVAAVAIGDDGKLTATRDYRRVSVSNALGPGLAPTTAPRTMNNRKTDMYSGL